MEAVSFAGEGLAPELVPADELADCAATVLAADGARILSYGTGFGYTPLRELLAERLGVHPYRVLLTNGWLQGFRMLLHARAMGQGVVCEYPTYDRALESIFQARANLLYLDLHPGGFADDQLEYIVRTSQKPALAYTNPTFHNPTGESLSKDKRMTLGDWLHNRARVPIVEDDSYGLLRFEGEPLPTMFELSRQSIVYSTSFSATIAPGLRVGVFVLTDELANELAAMANSIYIAPVLLAQATVFEFLQRGSFEPHLAWLNARLAERRDAAARRTRAALSGRGVDAARGRPLHPVAATPRDERRTCARARRRGERRRCDRLRRPAAERDPPQLRRADLARRDRARDRAAGSRLRAPTRARARSLENRSSTGDYCVESGVGYALGAVRRGRIACPARSAAIHSQCSSRRRNGEWHQDQGERADAWGAGEP